MNSPTLLHTLLGAERGGCERCAAMVMEYLPEVSHRVLLLGQGGPMEADFRAVGASVVVVPKEAINSSRKLIRYLEADAAAHPANAMIYWHGLPKLPQILYGLRRVMIPKAVYGGNPAHTMPLWVNAKFSLLGLRYPVPELPTYLCCSQYVADSFETSRYLRRFPRKVVYNGVLLPPVGARNERPADAPFTIGMLARLDTMKDHATLLQAFAIVRKVLPLARLEFAGGGDQEAALRRLAGELGLADEVRFHGTVTDVYSVMAGWDMVAYSTTEREGLGSALIEGMMIGLPVVASNVGPIREICEDGQTALLVPPADPRAMATAILRMADDQPLRQRLGRAGQESVSFKFNPANFASSYSRHLGLAVNSVEHKK